MNYEKPVCLDLSSSARAEGQEPQVGCLSGADVDEGMCVAGGLVTVAMCHCYAGASDV